MHFFVDESGNTGSNLFDPKQPNLYYGVLGCRTNLDVTAEPMLARLRTDLGVKRLHASDLGANRLVEVATAFAKFQKLNDVRLNFYTVVKSDHAVISFFDQIFDSGMNDAVPWHCYWTPLRYVLLLRVAELFDDDLRRRSWTARLEQNPERCAANLEALCKDLRARVNQLPDRRTTELVDGALRWAEARPNEIAYGASNRESALQISPNLVGFQQVLQGIAMASAKIRRTVRSITVDRQNEFNTAQGFLADIYRRLRDSTIKMPPGMPDFDWSNMPGEPPQFKGSETSAGLEMVDAYLWIAKRNMEGRDLPYELEHLLFGQRHRGRMDQVSLEGIRKRWSHLLHLPDPLPGTADRVREYLVQAEETRLEKIAEVTDQ
jgi:hypothetical protein